MRSQLRFVLWNLAVLAISTLLAAGPTTRIATPPPASGVATGSAPAADPVALIRRLADASVADTERYNSLQQLKGMGPALQPGVPEMCKLLRRTETVPGGSWLGKEVAQLLGRIGPDAAQAAITILRTDLAGMPNNDDSMPGLIEVLSALGPAAAPALADTLGDRSELLARNSARALAALVAATVNDGNVARAKAVLGPNLPGAWNSAIAVAVTRPPDFDVSAAARQQRRQWQNQQQWLLDLYILAQASGPKAIDALFAAAEAHARRHRPDAIAAAAAVKDLVRAAGRPQGTGPVLDTTQRDAIAKASAFGSAAIAPLAEVIAADAQSRELALTAMAQIVDTLPRGLLVDPTLARKRLILGNPPPVIPLDTRNRAAIAKVIPELAKLVNVMQPDGGNQETSALQVLVAVAPDVPAAAGALIASLDRIPEDFVLAVADALSRCDKTTLAKLTAASAAGRDRAKDIAFRAGLRGLPPKEAAGEIIAKVPPDSRDRFIGELEGHAGAEIVPLLIELLPDPQSRTSESLARRASDIAPALLAALDRPEPAIRAGALQAMRQLPAYAITPEIIAKVAAMLGDDIAGPEALMSLQLAGGAVVPMLVPQTHSAKPIVRLYTVKALGQYGMGTSSEVYSSAVRAQAAAAIIPILDDAVPSVRAAALVAASQLPGESRQQIVAKLKAAGEAERQRLAQALVDADTWYGLAEDLPRQAKTAAERLDAGSGAWKPGVAVREMPGLLFAWLTLDADPAVRTAVEDTMLRAYVAAIDRANARRSTPTTQEAAIAVKAKNDPDAKARANAVIVAANANMLDVVFGALNDPDSAVRVAALQGIISVLRHPAPTSLEPVTKLMALRDSDPSPSIRNAAAMALDNLRRDDMHQLLLPRLRLMARSPKESDRDTAAAVLRTLGKAPAQPPGPAGAPVPAP